MKQLLLVAVLIAGVSAHAANPERLVCESDSKKTVVVLENINEIKPLMNEINVEASLLIVKVGNTIIGDRVDVVGEKGQNAGGTYYDLTAPHDYAIFVAASAGEERSFIFANGKKIFVNCQ